MTTVVQSPSRGAIPVSDAGRDRFRVTFARAWRAELTKMFSLRSTWWVLLTMAVCCIGANVLAGVSVEARPDLFGTSASVAPATLLVETMAVITTTIGVAFVMVLAVLTITNEFGSGMIRSTLAAVPKRSQVLAAKALVLLPLAFIVTALINAISIAIGAAVLTQGGYEFDWTDPTIWRIATTVPLYATAWAALAFGLGTLARATAGGIAAAFGLLWVVPVVVNLLDSVIGWGDVLAKWLPTYAGTQTLLATPDNSHSLWVWGAILAAWALAAMGIGAVSFNRRDP